ncbi:MAG TPA: hypothetical protein VE915_02050 [Actinomycetota bacterium]|nr:hypothetical protein [Actinomycetota bacterium]
MRNRILSWGVVAAGLYILGAVLVQSTGRPVFPLFDGLGPAQPYRWVSPPPEAAATNQPALPGAGEVALKGNPQNFFVTTEDGQASLGGISDAFARQPRQNMVRVDIAPLDPQSLAPPPRGLIFDGNAYQFDAAYAPSGDVAVIEGKVQVIFRYPRRANVVLKSTDSGWERLESFVVRPALQVYSEVDELGTFVAAGPPPRVHRRSILPWIASAGAGVAVIAAGVAFFLRRRSRARTGRKKRPPAQRKRR